MFFAQFAAEPTKRKKLFVFFFLKKKEKFGLLDKSKKHGDTQSQSHFTVEERICKSLWQRASTISWVLTLMPLLNPPLKNTGCNRTSQVQESRNVCAVSPFCVRLCLSASGLAFLSVSGCSPQSKRSYALIHNRRAGRDGISKPHRSRATPDVL